MTQNIHISTNKYPVKSDKICICFLTFKKKNVAFLYCNYNELNLSREVGGIMTKMNMCEIHRAY